ncbi:hypothetical protein C8F04DRAFT_1181092 [Mycena alexandri]|uniref:F-box domain-containing protein n=1 Tax=Mycena alexandri TaxID=1745969 RepID=A0AAD6T0W4_9AGAR|nr:hypothetical protein C8F04DRAFT_1181092 [Mycena alexandri]
MSASYPAESAPVLRLPTEILSSILVDVVDPSEADWLGLINARKKVVCVCSRWRAVAASTPILWTRIYVAPAFVPYFITESIRKTSGADIFLVINPHVFRTIEDSGAHRTLRFLLFPQFLELLVEPFRAEFHRVRSLEVFDGYRSQMFAVMERITTFRAERLSSLRLSASDTYSNGSPPLPLGIRPKQLSVRRVEPLWNTPELYREVTTLSLARLSWLSWSELQPVLQSNAALRELRLSNVRCSTPIAPECATLPEVTIFKLRYETEADRRFVGFIKMPSLESFELVVTGTGTLYRVALDMPNVLRTAASVLVDVDKYITDDLTALVALCTSARIIDLRECRPPPYRALLRLQTIPNFSLPLLRVLKISGSLTKEDAAALLAIPFGGELAVNEWVLGDWVCRQWRMVGGEVTAKVIEGDSGRAGLLCKFVRSLPEDIAAVNADLDLAEPPLSVYNYAAVRVLDGRPYDEHWAAVLTTIDVVTLFKLSIRSKSLFEIVMSHVRACQPSYNNSLQNATGGVEDRLSGLPVEMFAIILPELNLGDRLALSRTSRKLRALCSRELQTCVKDLLNRFNLGHAEIRFMQTATFAVLCGHCISHLVDHTFDPLSLDFVTPNVTYKSVVRFLELATGLEPRSALLNNLYTPDGTTDNVKFGYPTQSSFIRVSRSITDNALDGVTYAPFSHLIGAVTHYGLWLAYPQTSTRKCTMPNRDCLDFTDPATDERIQNDFAFLHPHFEIEFELRGPHECGRAWECPMTPRTTVDDGCLSIFFPNLPMGRTDAPLNTYPSKTSMSWSLGGHCCSLGMVSVLNKVEMAGWQQRQRFDGYERWKRQFEQALRFAESSD